MTQIGISSLFNWIILPSLIFSIRVVDVSMGTLRIILMSRGKKNWVPFFGFVEIFIWLIAIKQIFHNLNNWMCYIAYAGGFAMGNYVGMWLDDKLALGFQVVRIITRTDASNLISALIKNGYGVTHADGEGATGRVKIIFTLIHRKCLPEVREMIQQFNPRAFYSVEDVRMATEGIFPAKPSSTPGHFWRWLKFERKGK